MKLDIVSLKGLEFVGINNRRGKLLGGYGFYKEGKGYVSFKGANVNNGVKIPYCNNKEVLEGINDAGGLVSLDDVEWLNPV